MSGRPPHGKSENRDRGPAVDGSVGCLSRFTARASHKALPLYNLLKKGKSFEWTKECETTFQSPKETLTMLPILTKPEAEEPLYMYLSVSQRAISAALV